MNSENDFALAPRSLGAIEKAQPGAKRIITSIIADTLALVKKEPPAKPVFSVLTCSGEAGIVNAMKVIIQAQLDKAYDVNVTDKNNAADMLKSVQERPVDLVVAMVNNILVPTSVGEDRILKAVELLARLKAQYRIPIIALSTFKPESFDLPAQLKLGGIDAFFWAPFDIHEFGFALTSCLKAPSSFETITRPNLNASKDAK